MGTRGNQEFWKALDRLIANSEIVIDRPKGSAHPRFENLIYRVNYGFLQDTSSIDGDGIDVYLGTSKDKMLDAVICTVDLMKRDSEIKLLIGCTEEEKDWIYQIHNETPYMKGIFISRENTASGDILVRGATADDLEYLWNENIRRNHGDERWIRWKEQYVGYNQSGMGKTFAVVASSVPVGEGTLLFDPACKAINGRTELADGKTVTNINALRIRKAFEGQGHISRMVKLMEHDARERGFRRITIGVEAAETRNLAIYLHWGYDKLVMSSVEDGVLVLYFAKDLEA